MANLLQHDTSTGVSNVAHLALDFQTGQNNDCNTALRSLLYDQLAKYPDHAEAILENLGGEYVQKLCATEKIQELLEGIFQCYSPIFLFIDGLDELASDAEIRKFMGIIEDFILKCPDLRIFLSCRPEALIRSRAKGWNAVELVLSERDSHRDIESYVLHAENKNFLVNDYGLDDKNATKYLNAIVDKSEGMFLYAKLIIGILPDLLFGVVGIDDLINQLPIGLKQAYERSLQRISNLPKNIRKQAKRIFKFVLGGTRSFRTIELVQAIWIHPNMKNFGKERQASLELICGSLIEIASDGIVSLVHSSLKSYLLECDDILGLRKFSVQLTLSRVCLEYLSIKSLQERDTTLYQNLLLPGEFVFLSYACKNFLLHFKQAAHEPGLNSISRKKLTKFLAAIENFSEPLIIDSQPKEKTLFTIISELRLCVEACEEQQNRLKLQHAINQFVVEVQGMSFKSIIAKQLAALMEVFNRNLTQVSGSCDPKSIQTLIRLYGPPFRCFDSACHHFYSGFMKQAEQERHAASHSKSFKCPEMSCPYHQIGFLSINELDKHDKAAHSTSLVASRTLERPKSDRLQQNNRDRLYLDGAELAKTTSLMLKSGDLAGAKEILLLMSGIPNLKLRKEGAFSARFMLHDICLKGIFQRQPENLEESLACYANGDILSDLGRNIFEREGTWNLIRAILSRNLNVIKYLLPTIGKIEPWNFFLPCSSTEEDLQYLKILLSEIATSYMPRRGYEKVRLSFPFEFYVHWVGDEKISEALKGYATIYSDTSQAELTSGNALFVASIAGNLSAVSTLLETGATLSKAHLVSLLAKMISSENSKPALVEVCLHLKSRGAAFWKVTADEVFVRGLKLRLLQTKQWSASEFLNGMKCCLELGVSPTDINGVWRSFPSIGLYARDPKYVYMYEVILDAESFALHLLEAEKVIRPLIEMGISATNPFPVGNIFAYKAVSLWEETDYEPPRIDDTGTVIDIKDTVHHSLTKRELAWKLHRGIIYDWMGTFSTKDEILEPVRFDEDFMQFFTLSRNCGILVEKSI
ncbi:hypothetical protein H072_7585 [Dactylellina haptotyla CBS 200.50]|uniref:NACHT domain-containing protein n=1 Tax=Dactylellina haptotyla (strain CBS 200.50) TaxID=1284197 RepID=S8BH66_DACHA|nr:hypothetical protein H072_7585 [Dactylellina haptotyla CBS 200.50]